MAPDAKSSVNSRILALCTLNMGFSIISAAFGFYYVKIFLNVYKIEEQWFQTAQVLFLIWNAINDPLFAFIQDSTNWSFTRTRREAVLYVSPFFALSFLVPWFPWGDPDTVAPWVTGVHLITSLCLWDTMFTYVGLAACCLFTEISLDNNDRLKATRATTVASLIGSSSIFILQQSSNQLEDFRTFQVVCVILAVISCMLMRYCGKHAHTERELNNLDETKVGSGKNKSFSILTVTKQILTNRDFLSFVIMNFFQEFHRAFLFGFFTIIGDQLIVKDSIPGIVRSAFYGVGPFISKSMVIFGAPIIGQYGYFRIMRYSYILKIAVGGLCYIFGIKNYWLLMLFMLADSSITDASYSLFNLPLSDIADSDAERHRRRHPVTSMIYGTNALIVKPSQSLSPMLVVAILNRYGYDKLKTDNLPETDIGYLNNAMFTLLCAYPFVIGTIQYITWSFYTIRHKKALDITAIIPLEA